VFSHTVEVGETLLQKFTNEQSGHGWNVEAGAILKKHQQK
jgi:hypothetical protein